MSGDLQFEWKKPTPTMEGYAVLFDGKFRISAFRKTRKGCEKFKLESMPYTSCELEIKPVRLVVQIGK